MTTGRIRGVVVAMAMMCAAVAHAQEPARGPVAPTFNKDVAPILFANCTTCHRPGEIAPMSLLTYKDARPWARSIASQVKNGTMPPWHADPSVGQFANERRLTDAQKATIARWVDAGAPEGDAKDLPPAPQYAQGWRIGQPDAILEMQEDYPIPAKGEVPYLYFEVPANFAEDRWIKSWEMRPGNPAVVHHVIVYVRPPQPAGATTAAGPQSMPAAQRPQPVFTFAEGTDIPAGQTGGPPLPESERKPLPPNYRPRPRGVSSSIGGYVPGNSTRTFPEGTAMRLPAGSTLVFQMHYTTIGEATSDRTKLGLIFAKEPPKMALTGTALVNGALHIPPGAPDHKVDAEVTINRDVLLFSMTPHTHVRGKRWFYEAIYPDGRREPILSVPNYDFEWQHEYVFKQPLKLPAGTKIHASAWYDNSPANKSNPDPKKDVWWGDQTWEEMMFTSMTFHVVPAAPPTAGQKYRKSVAMKRRDFLVSSALGSVGVGAGLIAGRVNAEAGDASFEQPAQAGTRKILIAGGGFNTAFIRYMATLTGKPRPKLLYLPTASADSASGIISWFRSCAPLNVEPSVQESFIASTRQTRGWEEVLLSVDGIVCSGGNTLNQQAIWQAQGIDVVLKQAWDRGIVLGGASAGSLCWFEEGTTDSRPKELTIVKCLGFLKGSHSPHYDAEKDRRPVYHKLIAAGLLKPGYACDNDAGIYFEDNAVKRVVATRDAAKVYYVGLSGGKVTEKVMEPERIS